MRINKELKNGIILMIVQFILIAVAGTIVGSRLQHSNWMYQNNLNKLDERRTASRAMLVDLSSKIDERIYKMKKCYWSIKNKKPIEEIESSWEAYRSTLDSWNSNLNKNLLNSKIYFNESGFQNFETIHIKMKSVGNHLDAVKRSGNYSADLSRIDNGFKELSEIVEYFYQEGFETIESL